MTKQQESNSILSEVYNPGVNAPKKNRKVLKTVLFVLLVIVLMGGTVLATTFYYENYLIEGDRATTTIVEPDTADYPGFIAVKVKDGKIRNRRG